MPCRGEDTAPIFNKLKPRELPKFFDQLDCLFMRAKIPYLQNDFASYCKRQILHYVDFEIEELWRAIPEFADPMMNS